LASTDDLAQLLAVGTTLVYSFVVTYVLCRILHAVLPGGVRVDEEEDRTGLDIGEHSEAGYAFVEN
jgi:Amt family ammonium transporter